MPSPLFILTGPSGAGKSTVARQLLDRNSDLVRFVTTTTRPPRPGEADGVAYHFVTREAFEKGVQEGAFFEWADVYGELYGSDKQKMEALRSEGRPILMVIDVKGAAKVRELVPDAKVIFLDAPYDALKERLEQRPGHDANTDARLQEIEHERAFRLQADYTIVNRDGALEETVEEIESILDRVHG